MTPQAAGENEETAMAGKASWMHRWLLIRLLLGGLLLSGCASPGERVAERIMSDTVGQNVEIDQASGETRIEYDEGAATVSASLPDGFPSQMPLPDGATVTFGVGVENENEDGTTFQVSADTDMDFDSLVAYYERELPAQGWVLDDNRAGWDVEGARMLTLVSTGHGYISSVVLSEDDGVVTIGLLVTPESD